MTEHSRAFALFLDLFGLNDFYDASVAADFWLSGSVMLRGLAALWLISCTVVFSVRAVRIALPGLPLVLRWSSIFGVGTWVSTMGFHALRELGSFNLPVGLAACTALGAVTVYALPTRAPWRWALRREQRAVFAVARLFVRHKYWFTTSLFCAALLLTTMRSLIIPPLGWDTITYHGPRTVHWLQTNQFTFDPGPGPYSLYRHFISGGEVLMAWAFLPFHSDLFANLLGVVQWLGVATATWGLARTLSVREPFASASAALVMFMPVLALEMNSGYVEAPLNQALLHGIALAVWCLRKPSGPVAVAAAMSLGIAAGIKLPGAPPGLLVLSALVLRFMFVREIKLVARFGFIALGVLGAALPVLPWANQAYIETGYPLSPMPVQVFGVTLGVSSPALQWYQSRPTLVPYAWDAEARAFSALFSGVSFAHEATGPALGVTSFIPLLMALVGVLYLLRRQPLVGAVLGAAMAAPWLTHFSAGLSVPRLLWSVSVARYLIVLMGMAIPVSFVWCKPGSTVAQTYRRILLIISLSLTGISLRHGFGAWEPRELVVVGITSLLLGTVCWWILKRPNTLLWQRIAVVALMFCLGCSALQLRRDQTRTLAYGQSFALHGCPRYWATAVPKVDELGVEHRIALTGGPLQNADNWFNYFFFGSRFQNVLQYVPPTRDAGIAYFGPFSDFDVRADRDAWISRLHARGMTEVLTFPPRSTEQNWMESLPTEFEKLDGGFDWGLYRLRQNKPK